MKFPVLMSVLIAGGLNASAGAASIGINFNGSTGATVPADQLAGVVPQLHYNNFVSTAAASGTTLNNDSGVDSGATLTSAALNASSDATAPGASGPNAGDPELMTGHSYLGGTGNLDLIVSTIPYSEYDVYVYYSAYDQLTYTQDFQVRNASDTASLAGPIRAVDPVGGFTGTYTQVVSSGDAGNYVRFEGLTASDIIIRSNGVSSTDTQPYSYVSGVQIVAVPEAAALSVVGVIGLGLLARRRRTPSGC